jgi:hypothetical protein
MGTVSEWKWGGGGMVVEWLGARMTKRKDGLRDAQSWVQPGRKLINMFIAVEAGEANLPEMVYILVVAEDTTAPYESLAFRTRLPWANAIYLLFNVDNRARWLDMDDK